MCFRLIRVDDRNCCSMNTAVGRWLPDFLSQSKSSQPLELKSLSATTFVSDGLQAVEVALVLVGVSAGDEEELLGQGILVIRSSS